MCSFDGFAEFVRAVGLIEDRLERLKVLGFSTNDFDDNGGFDTSSLPKLAALCEKHPEYHIVTQCDEGYYNQVRFVNRLRYFLADGNTAPELCVEACEVCKQYDCVCGDVHETCPDCGVGVRASPTSTTVTWNSVRFAAESGPHAIVTATIRRRRFGQESWRGLYINKKTHEQTTHKGREPFEEI